jgi:hypothetical protein
MSTFIFKNIKGETFTVTGPPEMTQEQANEIFKKQDSSGSLVGIPTGGILSAATQAKAGLTSALAQVGQTLSGITGALGGGISSAAGAIGSAATGALASAKSMATKALSVVTGAKSGEVTNGIGVADFTKQATALAPVAGMNVSQVTGALAQAKNLVGQTASKMTDSKGAGSFGFNAKQLETAGILKPGMSKYVESGASTLTSLLKSPSVFTGKDGIKSSSDLLSSPSAQSTIQQDLMAKGSAGLAALGTTLKNFNPADAAGLALNAAKSLPNTESLIKGLPLPADIKATMTSTIKAGAFAVNLVTTKIPAAFKAETTPAPAADTTNRETLNAATNRVIGNPKIPAPNYSSKTVDVTGEVAAIIPAYNSAISYIKASLSLVTGIEERVLRLEKQPNISRQEWEAINSSFQAAIKGYDNNGQPFVDNARSIRDASSTAAQLETKALVAEFDTVLTELTNLFVFVKSKLRELEAKIAG